MPLPRLQFRRATTADTRAAQLVYRQITDHLASTVDFPHWHTEDHPSPDLIGAWAEAGELYLAVAEPSGEIAGVVVLNHSTSEGYEQAAWAVSAESRQVLAVHALGVAPGFLRQGVARFLVDCSLETGKQQGCRTVRLDTFVDNVPARRLYASYGFTDLGLHTINYPGTDLNQFHLFEYVL